MDLPSSEWFGDFDPQVSIHIIDSARPLSLPSLFGVGENGDRIVVWDDGGAEKLEDVKKSWEALQASILDNHLDRHP
jgi:cell division control protein 45